VNYRIVFGAMVASLLLMAIGLSTLNLPEKEIESETSNEALAAPDTGPAGIRRSIVPPKASDPVVIAVELRVMACDIQRMMPRRSWENDETIISTDRLNELLHDAARKQASALLMAPRLSMFDSQEASVAIGERRKYIDNWTQRETDFEPIMKEMPCGTTVNVLGHYNAADETVALDVALEKCDFQRMGIAYVNGGDAQATLLPVERPVLNHVKWSGRAQLGKGEVLVAVPKAQDGERRTPLCILISAARSTARHEAVVQEAGMEF